MKVFGILFVGCVFLFGIVVMRVEINRSGRTISKLQNEVEVKESRNQYLQLEISRLSGPETVIDFAQKAGMVPLKPHEVIVLEDK